MPVKLGLKLRAVVRLHDKNSEGQTTNDLVDELDRRGLVAGIENLQDANARAVVDGCELIEPLTLTRDALEKLHVHLQSMTGLRFFVAYPALGMLLVLLIGRKPVGLPWFRRQ